MNFKEYCLREGINNKFADMPDSQRYYNGKIVKIISKEPKDEYHIWVVTPDGEKEVRMDDLSMSAEASIEAKSEPKKEPKKEPLQIPGKRGEMTESKLRR